MKHRHAGKYRSRTPRGRVVLKKKPTHRHRKKHKNKDYRWLKKRYKIHPLADDDGDKVRNYKDCRPWNRKRQDMQRDVQEEIEEELNKLKERNDISLYDVELEAKQQIELLTTQKETINRDLRDKRRLLTFNFDDTTIAEVENEIDELINKRQEIKESIDWLKNTDNLISFLPSVSEEKYEEEFDEKTPEELLKEHTLIEREISELKDELIYADASERTFIKEKIKEKEDDLLAIEVMLE